jgi:hypothetical protein
MKKLVVFLTLISSPSFAGDKFNIILGQSLDLASTEFALNHGAREGNFLVKERSARYLTKTAGTVLAIKTCSHLRKHGHEKSAKWASRGILILFAGVAVNNYFQGKR